MTRYHVLESQHGKLNPLAEIDLSPRRSVRVRVTLDEKEIWHNLNLSQKVGQVKKKILGLFGIEASRANQFLLVYWDSVMSSIQGPEELKFPGRAIHSYQPEEGDTFELCRLHKL